jgi:uncharacterized protein YkwD
MDRRGFLIGAGAALAGAGAARAGPAEEIVGYYERLNRALLDAGGGRFLESTEDRLLGEHNAFRRQHGLGVLQRHFELDDAARAHAADMLRRNFFAHGSPEGFASEQRVGLLARRFVGAAGENIAMQDGGLSPPTAADFARLWRESPGHRANMLRGAYTHVGFGVAAAGERVIAGAVFGQVYAELVTPAPFRIGGGDVLAGLLDGAAPGFSGYELEPVEGGPFAAEAAPQSLRPGAYAIRPHAPDPLVPYRYWILFGPIVVAG